MKQTAVSWLIEELFKQGYFDGNKPLSITNLDHLEHQSKEMEKQQIIDAYKFGLSDEYVIGSDKYYTSTYASKGSDEHHEDNLVEIPTSSQTEISDTEVEFAGTNAWVEYNFNVSDDAESFYAGWKLAIKWYREQLKQK